MKQKQTSCAQGAGRVLRRQVCCLLVRSVLWCVQLMNRKTAKKARRRTSQDEGRDSRKEQEQTATRWWVSLNLYLPGVPKWSGVISHDMSRYIVMSYFEVFYIMRYHKIRYIEILYYPYPEFLGLISRYRTPSKYFSIPNTIFCPVRCSKFGAPESWRNGYLEVELQKRWY